MASKVSLRLIWLFQFKSVDHYFKQNHYWSPKPNKSIKGMKIWDIGRNQLKSSCISVTSSWQVFEARDLETLQSIVCLYNQRSVTSAGLRPRVAVQNTVFLSMLLTTSLSYFPRHWFQFHIQNSELLFFLLFRSRSKSRYEYGYV